MRGECNPVDGQLFGLSELLQALPPAPVRCPLSVQKLLSATVTSRHLMGRNPREIGVFGTLAQHELYFGV